MNILPTDIQDKIYEYDGRYRKLWDDVINELKTKISWNDLIVETLIGSYMYYPGEIEYSKNFYNFYFDRFGRYRLNLITKVHGN